MNITEMCIFCGTKDGLTSRISVTIDGQKWTAAICEKDEEQASPASIKITLAGRLKEIEELRERAAKLGFSIVTQIPAIQADLLTEPPHTQPPVPLVPPTNAPKLVLQPQQIRGQPLRPQTKSSQALNPPAVSRNPQSPRSDSESLRSIRETAEMQPIETVAGGIRGFIPKRTVGDTGISEIHIVHSTDADIKKTLQGLNDDRRQPLRTSNQLLHDCTMCNGKGRNRINNEICGKCKGRGILI